jgi:NADPH:quinone reductase-like Zn-dependent oxidoreductase
MRAIRYHEFGGPEVLAVESVPTLDPDPDEVRVRVVAAGVNPCDALRREGLWDDPLPLIPGSDVAGEVTAVGAHAAYEVGDRVFGTVPMLNVSGSRGDRQGTYAEEVVVRTDRLAPLDDDVSFAAGAAVGLVGCTAWRGLVEFGRLRPGGTCLIHGGTGGVGHVAVQLAAAMGATVVATGHPDRLDVLSELGADHAVDYTDDDVLVAAVDALDHPPDVVFDHMFGAHAGLDVDVVAPGGSVVVIGGNHDQPRLPDLTAAIGKDVTIQPFDVFNLADIDRVLGHLAVLMRDGDLSVRVARRYDLDEAAAAHRAVAAGGYVGKVVVEP